MRGKVVIRPLLIGGLFILLVLALSCMVSCDINKSNVVGINKVTHRLITRGIGQIKWANFPNLIYFTGNDGVRYFLYSLNLGNTCTAHVLDAVRHKCGENKKVIPNYSVAYYTLNFDRSEVAFWGRNTDTGDEGVFIYHPDENSLRYVDQASGFPETWSPDGKRLVINGACEDPIRHACSYLFDIESSRKEILSLNGETKPFNSSSWSPDGKRIAFVYGDPFVDIEVYGIYVIDLKDYRTRKLISANEEGIRLFQPKWIRAGEWLVYLREGPSDESELYFANVENSNCKINPLSMINPISSYDVYENGGNLFFVIIDKHQNIFTVDFKQALNAQSIEEVFVCSKE
jgi:Tol biopolymer transport system component